MGFCGRHLDPRGHRHSFRIVRFPCAVVHFSGGLRLTFGRYTFALFQTGLKGRAADNSNKQTIPTFLTLYIFGFVYELALVYDALRLKNTIQVIGLCMYNYALLIYAAIQMTQINDAVRALRRDNQIKETVWTSVRPFLIATPCVIAVGSMCMSFVARKLYDEFAWTIYKHISADLRMKRRYLTFQVNMFFFRAKGIPATDMEQIYIALLKFDVFFFLGFTIQFVVIVVSKSDVEFYLTIAAIPVTILILIAGGLFTRRENKPGMVAIIVSLPNVTVDLLVKLTCKDSLRRRLGLFPLQTGANVPTHRKGRELPSRPQISDYIRRPGHCPNSHDNHQCGRLLDEFRQGSTAIYCAQKIGERGGEAEYDDRDAELGPRWRGPNAHDD